MSLVVRLLVLLPAIAALTGLLARRSPRAAALLATGAAAVGLLLAVLQVLGGPSGEGRRAAATIETIGALPVGDLSLPLHLLTDRSSALVAIAVTVVGLAVQVFSVWYLHDDDRYPVFAAEVSLFLAGMLLVVQSGDLVLTLIGWEVMGWCSYLLIGHVTARESARRAAYKAFLVTRVADIGFVLGVVLLAVAARTTDIDGVLQHFVGFGLEGPRGFAPFVTGSTVLTVALVGLVVGVAGKSGLVPFHDWLPDAMEGPTPASALIHAATMVAAGTVVIARLSPLYAAAPSARAVLGVLAAVTMLWAALLAFAQSDVKRMLAYSTLSQIAIMLSALAFAPGIDEAPSAGLGHLFSHALFKSLLFLAIGWLSVIGGGTAFVALRGRARGRGALQWSIGIGLAALAGVPPLVGFFSKEGVLAVAEESLGRGGETAWVTWVVLVALLLTVLLTAAYCARAWLLLTTDAPSLETVEALEGQTESAEPAAAAGDDEPTGAHEARPVTLSAALAVSGLAILTVAGTLGLIAFPQGPHLGLLLALVSVVLIAGAAALVRARAAGGVDPADALGAAARLWADRGFGVDTAYVGVGRAVVALARVVARLDRDVVDAYPRAAARLTLQLGAAGDRVHRGAPSTGLVAVVVGVVLLGVAGVTVWR